MLDPSTWNCTWLMAAPFVAIAPTMTVPEIVAPGLGELIETLNVLAGGVPVWLFETKPAQPEIAKLSARTSGHALREFFCESLSHSLYKYEFFIRILGFPLLL